MNKKVILLGGSGLAKVIADILSKKFKKLHEIVSPEIDQHFSLFKSVKHSKNDSDVLGYYPGEFGLVNGIGSSPNNVLRGTIFEKFCKSSYEFLTLKSDHSIVREIFSSRDGCADNA